MREAHGRAQGLDPSSRENRRRRILTDFGGICYPGGNYLRLANLDGDLLVRHGGLHGSLSRLNVRFRSATIDRPTHRLAGIGQLSARGVAVSGNRRLDRRLGCRNGTLDVGFGGGDRAASGAAVGEDRRLDRSLRSHDGSRDVGFGGGDRRSGVAIDDRGRHNHFVCRGPLDAPVDPEAGANDDSDDREGQDQPGPPRGG